MHAHDSCSKHPRIVANPYKIAGVKFKKLRGDLTWTLGLRDIPERNLRAMRRLGKEVRGQAGCSRKGRRRLSRKEGWLRAGLGFSLRCSP